MTIKATTTRKSSLANLPTRTAFALFSLTDGDKVVGDYDQGGVGTLATVTRTGRVLVLRTTEGTVEFPADAAITATWREELGKVQGARYCKTHDTWAVVRSAAVKGTGVAVTIRCLACEAEAMKKYRTAKAKAKVEADADTDPTVSDEDRVIAERIDRVQNALEIARHRTAADMIASILRHILAASFGDDEKGQAAKARAYEWAAKQHGLTVAEADALLAKTA